MRITTLILFAGTTMTSASVEAVAQGPWVPIQENANEWVYYTNDQLHYQTDTEGNRIPDFSYAGYRNGLPVPTISDLINDFDLPIVRVHEPLPESPTSGIQEAIDEACSSFSKRSANRDGQGYSTPEYLPEAKYRAIVQLGPGEFRLNQPIAISCSGLVLLGHGQRSEEGLQATVLIGLRKSDIPDRPDRSPVHQHNEVVFVGTDTWHAWNQYALTEAEMARRGHSLDNGTVSVGQHALHLQGGRTAAEDFQVGDNIIVIQKCSDRWILDRHRGGIYQRVGYPNPEYRHLEWECDESVYPRNRPFELRYNRYITDIQDGTIIIDAPVYDHLNDNDENVVFVALHVPSPAAVQHVGIQNLSIVIDYDPAITCLSEQTLTPYHCSEANTRHGIQLRNVQNSWIRNVDVYHFRYAAVTTDQTARVTIQNVTASEPVSVIASGRRYVFHLGTSSQLVLVAHSRSFDGRHSFVANGLNISGNVFHETDSWRSLEASSGHQRWSHGLLWDNHTEHEVVHHPRTYTVVGMYNRHYWSGHGWSTVQSVLWNADLGGGTLRLQQPPRAMNWALGIADAGPDSSCGHHHIPHHPYQHCIQGQFSRQLTERQPTSLYRAQLKERSDLNINSSD